MTFDEAIAYLNSFVNYEKKKKNVYDTDHYNLEAFHELLHQFGDPHLKLKTIHVTGTKGKGSTVEYIKNILAGAGYSVGTFTSPHVHDVRERIRINDEWVEKDIFAAIVERIKPITENREHKYRTFFELMTLISFLYFLEKKVDYAVYEVGMGGRLDSTNVVMPLIAVITSVDLDHMDTLGDTILKIASEKAGIIKEHTPVVIGKQLPRITAYLEAMALKHNAHVYLYGKDFSANARDIKAGRLSFPDIHCDMPGYHQRVNAATAAMAVEAAGITVNKETVRNALEKTQLSGRIERLQIAGKTVIVDAGHTLQSVKMLFETMHEMFPGKRYWSVVTYSSGKRIKEMLALEERYGMTTVLTQNASFRSESTDFMQRYCKPHAVVHEFKDAIYYALDHAAIDDIVIIHGTFLMMPVVYEHLENYGK